MIPSDQDRVRFLLNVQRLLREGQFTATYKYALLLALADISVEYGDDSGDALAVTTAQIAEKFIEYYWRQVVPYPGTMGSPDPAVLRQNTDRQAAVVRLVATARERYGGSLPAAQRSRDWRQLVQRVAAVVSTMPLWKLQVVGGTVMDFLYAHGGDSRSITLRPGVAFCLRQFHGLVTELVRAAWARYVRRQNQLVLGDAADLNEFLFGSERANLAEVRNILDEAQEGWCFYCRDRLRGDADVDHFVPWVLYPVDLGHNFVLADRRCNSKKSGRLAAVDHLAAWIERNLESGAALSTEFERRAVPHNLTATFSVARWAYSNAQQVGGLTWREADRLVPVPPTWTAVFKSVGQ